MKPAIVASLAIAFAPQAPLNADSSSCDAFYCPVKGVGNGVVTEAQQPGNGSRPKKPGTPAGPGTGAAPTEYFEYGYTSSCGGGTPGSANADVLCEAAFAACRDVTPPTPLTVVWRRLVDAGGSPIPGQGWSRVGQYCVLPNLPGAPPPPPRLTIADVQREFHLTPWATAGVTIQPPNGVTLVNLDTFYRLTWTQAGFEPGETDTIDPARMLGHTVKIKPRIVAITYNFGDGTSSPPTTDVGAPWPKGKIKHTYLDKGTYQVSADIEMTADFTIDGSGWIPIDNTVTLHSTPTTLVAKEAHPILNNK